jgi:hypothetical protein
VLVLLPAASAHVSHQSLLYELCNGCQLLRERFEWPKHSAPRDSHGSICASCTQSCALHSQLSAVDAINLQLWLGVILVQHVAVLFPAAIEQIADQLVVCLDCSWCPPSYVQSTDDSQAQCSVFA